MSPNGRLQNSYNYTIEQPNQVQDRQQGWTVYHIDRRPRLRHIKFTDKSFSSRENQNIRSVGRAK